MIGYKVTDDSIRTRCGFQFKPGVVETTWAHVEDRPPAACTSECLHAFADPWLAVMTAMYYCNSYVPARLCQ
jgi:hypothetical protein